MQIRNATDQGVFVYFYDKTDISYVGAMSVPGSDPYADNGVPVQPGTIFVWREDQYPQIKVGVRDGATHNNWLVHPGELYQMTDIVAITSDGRWRLGSDVTVTPGDVVEETEIEVEFVDLRRTGTDVEREVSFTASKAFSSWRRQEMSRENISGWTVGASFGGTITPPNNIAEFTSELKAEYQNKVTETLSNSYGSQVESAWSRSASQKTTFAAGKLHVLTTVWTLQVQQSESHYLGVKEPVQIVVASKASDMQIVSVDSPDELQGVLKIRYDEYAGAFDLARLQPPQAA